MSQTDLYESDLYAWTQENAAHVRAGRLDELDYEHLAEELEELMGNNRRLRVLLAHLLKWRFQPERRSSSWAGTLRSQRDDIGRLLKQSPSLRRLVPEEMREAYAAAVELAAVETGLARRTFPQCCPFDPAQTLDPEYWPPADER
jgi:hypothetical protein